MIAGWFNEKNKGMRIVLHILFIALSFFVLLNIFKINGSPARVDYVYAGLFLGTLLPVVYFHLYGLLPGLGTKNPLVYYLIPLALATGLFVWLNMQLFDHWSARLFPKFFFISYYNWWEITLFFIIFIVITGLLKLSKSWFTVNRLQRELLETDKQRVQAELKALKAQINPHFFFNTLNSVYSMSLGKDDRLPGTVLQLSELMRYFLYESKEDFVPLSREIQILKDYIALQTIRSDESLKIETFINDAIGVQKIAPLLLITFVENAFKHGAKGDTGKAFISIQLNADQNTVNFRVENNKGSVDTMEPDEYKGLGLDNVKRRLELIYPRKYNLDIDNTGTNFIVQLQLETT